MQLPIQNPALGSDVPDAETVERVTREVLSRSEFQKSALEEWGEYLMRSLRWGLDRIGDWAEAHPTLRWVVAGLLFALLLLLVGHMLYTIAKAIPSRQRISRLGLSGGAVWRVFEGRARSWEEALRLARKALAQGDLYQAVWIGHRLLLGLLDQKGALQFLKWKTNSDYLDECRSREKEYSLLEAFSRTYDEVVYAHRAAAPRQVEILLDQVDELRKSPGYSY